MTSIIHSGLWSTCCHLSGVSVTMDAAKNEATRTADRANGQQMVRVSPPTSSEERKRLMPSLPCPSDSAPLCAQPHVDGCPECVVNVEPPEHVERTPAGCAAFYRCHDCGHDWTTAWGCS